VRKGVLGEQALCHEGPPSFGFTISLGEKWMKFGNVFGGKKNKPSQSVWLGPSVSDLLYLPSFRTVQLQFGQGYFRRSRLVPFHCHCPAAGAERGRMREARQEPPGTSCPDLPECHLEEM